MQQLKQKKKVAKKGEQAGAQKQNQKQNSKQGQEQDQEQAQGQEQSFLLKSALVYMVLLFGAVAGRAALQGIPSVEPITALAILAGILFGSRVGFIFGAKAMFLSNFIIWGGHGPWTPFQVLGMGIAGLLGGLVRRKGKGNSHGAILVTAVVATLFYELIMNLAWGAMLGPFGILLSFAAAIPFGIVHMVSNVGFCLSLPKLRKFISRLRFEKLFRLEELLLGK